MGSFETCMLKAGASKEDTDLSEQWLLDCAYRFYQVKPVYVIDGCKGAWPQYYAEWFVFFSQVSGNAPHENSKTYKSGEIGKVTQCEKNLPVWNSGAMANNYIYKAQCPEEDLKTLIHEHGHAVVLVAAHGKSWDNYQSGVLEDCEYHKKCPEESSLPKTDPNYKVCKKVNHAVVAVGYGTENGVDYWLLKNSYSDSWGENGFFKVKRGTCGIEENSCTTTTCVATPEGADPVPDSLAKPTTPSATCNVLGLDIDWDRLAGKNGHVFLESKYKTFEGNLKCTKGGAEGTPGQCQCLDDLGDETCCQAICGHSKCPPEESEEEEETFDN